MKQLEIRYYTREEIGEITGIDSKNTHFKRNVGNTLTNWGYQWSYGKKSFTITAIPQTAVEKLSEIMMRRYDMDIRSNPYDFTIFSMCLLEDIDGFASMPWNYRTKYLLDYWDINVCEKTLRNWCNKLLKTSTIVKDKKDKTYWCTYKVDGVKYQEELEGGRNNPMWKAYWNKFFEYKKNGSTNPAYDTYMELQHCVYSCAKFAFSAFDDISTLEEMISLIAEIANQEAFDTVISCKIEITEVPRVAQNNDCMKASTKEEFEKCWKI